MSITKELKMTDCTLKTIITMKMESFLLKISTSGDNDHATHSLTPSSGAVPANTDKTADEDTDSEEYLDLFGNYDLLVPYDLQESDSETSKDEGVEASDKYQEKHVVPLAEQLQLQLRPCQMIRPLPSMKHRLR